MPRGTKFRLSANEMQTIARSIAEPRRYAILMQIAAGDGPVACCVLTEGNEISPATMSHHLRQLENAGLITIGREGKFAMLQFVRPRFDGYLRQLAEDTAPPEASLRSRA